MALDHHTPQATPEAGAAIETTTDALIALKATRIMNKENISFNAALKKAKDDGNTNRDTVGT